MKINHDKAYILGLFVGGAKINGNHFIIELPFKKWGMEPERMNSIAVGILTSVSKKFKKEYNIPISYQILSNKWTIEPVEKTNLHPLLEDLKTLGLPTVGFLLNNADLKKTKEALKGIEAESFLSGIFDTRASIAKSHRRFESSAPVVSIEIPGKTQNFNFVVQLCSWLTDFGSVTDQILYNHPNQHSSADPNYKGWIKGFKIRFLVQSFLAKYSFVLQAKSMSVTELEKVQTKTEQLPCPLRQIRTPREVAVHKDNNHADLPDEVRGKLFFHYFHYCAVLGCQYAPYQEVNALIENYSDYVTFYPRLAKGSESEMTELYTSILNSSFMGHLALESSKNVENILIKYKSYSGLKEGLAYLFSEKLNGRRHAGSLKNILETAKTQSVIVKTISDKEPLLLINPVFERACIVSNNNSPSNQNLILTKIKKKGYSIVLQ